MTAIPPEAPNTDIAFSSAVKAEQERRGSRQVYAKLEGRGGWAETITPDLAAFIAERDSFYLGSASADGQPYIQHRGGPVGFLKVVGERTLAFADFAGNRQYISMGNLAENDRAFIFLMDYEGRRRIKLWGRARFVEDDAELLAALADRAYKGKPERALVFEIDVWDRNCPQHITPRVSAANASEVDSLKARVAELEAEVERLRHAV